MGYAIDHREDVWPWGPENRLCWPELVRFAVVETVQEVVQPHLALAGLGEEAQSKMSLEGLSAGPLVAGPLEAVPLASAEVGRKASVVPVARAHMRLVVVSDTDLVRCFAAEAKPRVQ